MKIALCFVSASAFHFEAEAGHGIIIYCTSFPTIVFWWKLIWYYTLSVFSLIRHLLGLLLAVEDLWEEMTL